MCFINEKKSAQQINNILLRQYGLSPTSRLYRAMHIHAYRYGKFTRRSIRQLLFLFLF